MENFIRIQSNTNDLLKRENNLIGTSLVYNGENEDLVFSIDSLSENNKHILFDKLIDKKIEVIINILD